MTRLSAVEMQGVQGGIAKFCIPIDAMEEKWLAYCCEWGIGGVLDCSYELV
ncbi:MAG: hypothetical protein ACYSTZ_10285 [Planctomycetota bacterium]|jgi:hypothetical protein